MLKREETQKTLDSFIKYLVTQSKANLTRGKSNVSKGLYNSIKGGVVVRENSFEAYFEMEKYGEFQDKGVKGKSSSLKAPRSPYRFGTGTGQKGGLTKGIKSWVVAKKFQFQDRKTKKFLSYEQTASLITRSIYNKGIAPTYFFTKPYEKAFTNLPKDLITAYALDVETFLKYTIKNGTKN
jgi:hypothetical protein